MNRVTVLPAFYSRMTGTADAANGPDSLANVRGLAAFGAVAAARAKPVARAFVDAMWKIVERGDAAFRWA